MVTEPTRTFRTRVGKVRFKSGCELRVLPSDRERRTKVAQAWLNYHSERLLAEYADDLAGYVAVAWDSKGCFTFRARCYTQTPSINILPNWLAEAARRETANFDMTNRLGLPDRE